MAERERIIEVSVILIALFLFLIFVTLFIAFVVNPSFNNENITGKVVSINQEPQESYSYNPQIINSYDDRCRTELVPYYDYEYAYKKSNHYLYDDRYYDYDFDDDYYGNNYRGGYSSYKTEKVYEGFSGKPVREYNVYVENRGRETELFFVRFYFEDYRGREFTERVDHYIKPGETEKFSVKDINDDERRYKDWSYKVYEGLYDFDYDLDEDGREYHQRYDDYELRRYPVQRNDFRVVCY